MALIICTECGKRFSDKASACPKCGCPITNIHESKDVLSEKMSSNDNTISVDDDSETSVTGIDNNGDRDVTNQTDDKSVKKQFLIIPIFIGIIILIIGTVVFAIVVHINNPSRKINKAIEVNDIEGLIEIYPQIQNQEDLVLVQDYILSYCELQYDEYKEDNISYEKATKSFDLAKEALAYNVDFMRLARKLENLYESKESYLSGSKFFIYSDYKSALSSYRNVISEDLDYVDAQEKISECLAMLQSEVLGEWICTDNSIEAVFAIGGTSNELSDGFAEVYETYNLDICDYLDEGIDLKIVFTNGYMELILDVDEDMVKEAYEDFCVDFLLEVACEKFSCNRNSVWTYLYMNGIYSETDLIEIASEIIPDLTNLESKNVGESVIYYENTIIIDSNQMISYTMDNDKMKWVEITENGETRDLEVNFVRCE